MPVIETVISTPQESSVTTVDYSKPAEPAQPEAPTTEVQPAPPPAPEPKPEQPVDDPKFAARFAALSRRENEIRAKEQSLKEQLAQANAYKQAVEQAKKDPIALLKAAGYKDLEDYLGNVIHGEPAPDPYKQKVDNIENDINEFKKTLEVAKTQQMEQKKQQEMNMIMQDINQFVDSNSDKYKATKAYDGINDIWELIETVYVRTHGQVHLTVEQAANEVEQYYLDQAEQDWNRANALKTQKLPAQPELSNVQQVQHKADTSTWQEPKSDNEWTVPPTLTNANTSMPQPNGSNSLTKEERLRKAAAALKWTDD